jgi:hypothetical protein
MKRIGCGRVGAKKISIRKMRGAWSSQLLVVPGVNRDERHDE